MQLIANNNQQTKITKYSYNVKKEVTQSDTPWVNIQNAPHSRHFADRHSISQLDTIKNQVTGDYMIRKNTTKNETYVGIDAKCATLYTSYTHCQYFQFS